MGIIDPSLFQGVEFQFVAIFRGKNKKRDAHNYRQPVIKSDHKNALKSFQHSFKNQL